MKRKTIGVRLAVTTSIIMLGFLGISVALFSIFLAYFSRIIEKTYGIDSDILAPFFSFLLFALGLLVVLALVTSVLAGYFVSDRLLSTIKQFTKDIKQIQVKGIDQRLLIEGEDELDTLGIEFNKLMDTIETSMDNQNQFVADASHELRTPLAILKGNIDMLTRWGKESPEVLNKSLLICQEEIERMISLTNNLLDLPKEIDSSNEISLIHIDEEIEKTIEKYQHLYPDFKFSLVQRNNSKVKIHKEHLSQMIMILLDNAIKYSKDDSKKVEFYHFEDRLEIKDYGIGINQENLDKIFNRFYRADASRKKNGNSFGLGLSIFKRLIDAYGFDVLVESKEEEYTKFVIIFKGENENEKK